MKVRAPLVIAACSLILASASAGAADLITVYQRALQNDPQIREADALRLASRESKPQALAALLPQLEVSGSYSKFDEDRSRTDLTRSNPEDDESPLVPFPLTSTADITAKQYDLVLRQSLFRWDQWMTLRRADAQVAQAEADFQFAQQDLIQRTSVRYFDVLAAQDTVDAAQAALDAFARQLEQANKRFEVGLIAITDVQEAKAAHDQAAAALIQAKRSLATARELLRELTGESFDSLATPVDDMPLKTPEPANEEQWVSAALEQNLQVISARLATDIAKQDVRVARSGHLPSIDLVASRGDRDYTGDQVGRNAGGVSRAPADQSQVTDSIGVQVTIPIYSGGATSSRVRQQVYLHRAARERLERANRETERSARDAYLGVLSEISRVQALRQALESSRTALQATEAGFEVGTRTTVDVLDARRRLFEAQTNYARSRYDYILNVLQLQLATGTLDRADLEEINSFLRERAITR
ncbi:MAG TPA: TolC family outer membrane protein [Steroidobacter sp.]|uniref:TolC family outer membrane protein n=1 Tax=Steroidobacter sp. TaxID=1978227 RepID=UPI002ED79EB9